MAIMDEELKKLLDSNLILNKENNEILKKIYRAQKLRQITNIVKIILIVGFALGAFYFLESFLDNTLSAYGINSIDIQSLLR